MRKYTLIENTKLDPHTYLVTIGTDLGQFTGVVECREEDWEYESEYFGYELAEMKAEIEYARAKKKYFNAQLEALRQFWREMSETRNYDLDAYWVKKMRQKVADIESYRNIWADRVDDFQTAYVMKVGTFDAMKKTRNRCKEWNNG